MGDNFLKKINNQLEEGWEAKLTQEGRIYYTSHNTQSTSWLPPRDNWEDAKGLPYGWESAVDKNDKPYFINHVEKYTTRDDPRDDPDYIEPPKSRDVDLVRDSEKGFGFVAGSEKPVVVRFVTEGGPSENKLLPGDQILKVNGQDVKKAPREFVIDLVRSCKESITLSVCQPYFENTSRKSAILTAAKKAKLKNNPSRVRFAESVVVNGSNVNSPSPCESYVPFMPNVLKVFLENGQTKSFKYDNKTTVKDVMASLQEKLNITCVQYFNLVLQNMKSHIPGRLTFLMDHETLADIASRPGARHFRCLLRVTYVPRDAYDLLKEDPTAFEYFYMQCCNDIVQERFANELKFEAVMKLAALQVQQHVMSHNLTGKISIKAIEKEWGLEKFVPKNILSNVKRKEIRKSLSQYLKMNQNLTAPGQKQLTSLQAKLHFMKIVSELKTFGSRVFMVTLLDKKTEAMVLVGPKAGISLVTNIKSYALSVLADYEQIKIVTVTKDRENMERIDIELNGENQETLSLGLLTEDAPNFVKMVEGYYKIFVDKDHDIIEMTEGKHTTDPDVLPYNSAHRVNAAPWSYPEDLVSEFVTDMDSLSNDSSEKSMDLSKGPPEYEENPEYTAKIKEDLGMKRFVLKPGNGKLVSITIRITECKFEFATLHCMVVASDLPLLAHKLDGGVNPKQKSSEDKENTSPVHSENIPHMYEESVTSFSAATDDDDVEDLQTKSLEETSNKNNLLNGIHGEMNARSSKRSGSLDDSFDSKKLKNFDELLYFEKYKQTSNFEDVIVDEASSMSSSLTGSEILELDNIPGDESDDTDSFGTPHDSPAKSRHNSSNTSDDMDQSFGLISPDCLPETETEFAEVASKFGLQSPDNLPSEVVDGIYDPRMFYKKDLYVDPDIIDLTMLPPPEKHSIDDNVVDLSMTNSPPPGFTDKNGKAINVGVANSQYSSILYRNVCPYEEVSLPDTKITDDDADSGTGTICSDTPNGHQTLQPLSSSANTVLNSDLETLIATLTMPPPPGCSNGNDSVSAVNRPASLTLYPGSLSGSSNSQWVHPTTSDADDQLISLIVPPPPESSITTPDDIPIVPPVEIDSVMERSTEHRKVRTHRRSSSLDLGNWKLLPSKEGSDDTEISESSLSSFDTENGIDSPGKVAQKLLTLLNSGSQVSENKLSQIRGGSLRLGRSSSVDRLMLKSVQNHNSSTNSSHTDLDQISNSKTSVSNGSFSKSISNGSLVSAGSSELQFKRTNSGNLKETNENSPNSESRKPTSEGFLALKAKLQEYRDLLLSRAQSKRRSASSGDASTTESKASDSCVSKSSPLKRSNSLTLVSLKHHRVISSSDSALHKQSGSSEESSPVKDKKAPKMFGTMALPMTKSSLRPMASGTQEKTSHRRATSWSKMKAKSKRMGPLKALTSVFSSEKRKHDATIHRRAVEKGTKPTVDLNSPTDSSGSESVSPIEKAGRFSLSKGKGLAPQPNRDFRQPISLSLPRQNIIPEDNPFANINAEDDAKTNPYATIKMWRPMEKNNVNSLSSRTSNLKETIENLKALTPKKYRQKGGDNFDILRSGKTADVISPQVDSSPVSSFSVLSAGDVDAVNTVLKKVYSEESFTESIHDVENLLQELKQRMEHLKESGLDKDSKQFKLCKDEVITQTKRFVNNAKLLVSSATQTKAKLAIHMNTCLHTLAKLFLHGQATMLMMESVHQAQHLGFEIIKVSNAFKSTLNAAEKAVGKPLGDPHMKYLMRQATHLASLLSMLLRILRTVEYK